MRKLFLIGAVLLATTAAHAGLSDNSTRATADITQPSSEPPDDPAPATKDQASPRQKRRMAMQREILRHPIRTRFQLGFLRFKRQLYFAFH
jgi:hypothetical protein